jgi:PKD repeat protein
MKRITKKLKWGPALAVLLLLLFLVGVAAADPYVGGIPLTTVKSGTVSGGVYVDAENDWWPPNPGPHSAEKAFAPIPNVNNIAWARFYVAVYIGHQQNNYQGTVTVEFDGDGIGDYDTLGTETLNVPYSFPGTGGTGPVTVNDHCNRVTSDYLMWYDVTDDIYSQTPGARVTTSALDGSFDGRIKLITLVVAYNDGDTDTVYYWVNQGHDTDTYLYSGDYVGVTEFDLTGVTGTVQSASLMVNHMASTDGSYMWYGDDIPTDPSGATVPPGSNFQGDYFGYNIWDMTNLVEPGDYNDLTYDRNDQFYKIPLAILTVKKQPAMVAPVADFSADPLSGETPLIVQFTDLSTGPPTSWNWEYRLGTGSWTQFSTAQHPSHTFTDVGSYRIRLTATNTMGSNTKTSSAGYITVSPASGCDLTVTAINPIASTVFAREPNTVRVTVKNIGAAASAATTLQLVASDGFSGSEPIPALASNEETTVAFLDPEVRDLAGGTVTYTATVDLEDEVAESDETNNELVSPFTVTYNGYKGKRYWAGASDITTKRTFDLNGGLLHSFGDSTYRSGGTVPGSGWSSYTVTWTAADLPVPAGATVREARLYVPYTWDDTGEMPDRFHITFNGNDISSAYHDHYQDRSNFGGHYDNDYGLLTYDVTSLFSTAGNTAYLSKEIQATKVAMYGLTLVVVYEDTGEPRRQIFINEEFDIFGADESGYATTPEEATAYVPFSGLTINPTNVISADLITFVPSGNMYEGNLLFNDETIATNVWDYGLSTGTQVAVDSRDVKNYIDETDNEAGIQSTAGAGPLMAAAHQFLVLTYTEEAPVANFEGTPLSGEAPLTVQFTDISAGTITEWEWDFGDTETSVLQNPSHTYTAAGTYTVTLTVTGPGGSDVEEKINYITVSAAPLAPVAAFTATPLLGLAPLSVTFTDQSTNTPTGWSWEYNAGSGWVEFSTEKNSSYSFAAGPYDIRLTATNSGGSGVETKTHYIAVATGRQPLVNVQNGTVTGDLFVDSPRVWDAKEFTKTYTLPPVSVGNIQWARLYVNTYSGSAQNTYVLTSTVTLDGTILGVETMDIASETNGNSYPLNDHVTKVYSDYEAWYDVTSLITTASPVVHVKGEAIPGKSFDGRLKAVTLVVAYDDPSSTTETRYWVNHGHDWSSPGSGQTVFDTSAIPSGWSSAESKIRHTASSDGSYTFNGVSKSGGGSTPAYDGQNTWDVTADITAGQSSTLAYSQPGGSYKTPLATLKVQYLPAPTAAFSADQTVGDKPLTVQFTDDSGGVITGWSWTFGDGGISTDQSPTHTYTGRGTYDVALTVTGPGGSSTETKTGYITVKEPAPVIDFTADDTTPAILQTVTFTATNTGGQVTDWLWDFGDGGTSDQQNPTHQYTAEGTYTVSLTATGPDYSDAETKTNYIQVGAATFDVSVSPSSIAFGAMTVGDQTDSTSVTVTTTGGTAWSVDAKASNGGFMGTGSVNLANPFQLANGLGDFQAMTSDFVGFMTGAAGEDRTDTANVKQTIVSGDAPGDYTITLTFTGGFV